MGGQGTPAGRAGRWAAAAALLAWTTAQCTNQTPGCDPCSRNPCPTTGGTGAKGQCQFPFTAPRSLVPSLATSAEFHQCTPDHAGTADPNGGQASWCATATDSDHVTTKWGFCSSQCLVVSNQKFECFNTKKATEMDLEAELGLSMVTDAPTPPPAKDNSRMYVIGGMFLFVVLVIITACLCKGKFVSTSGRGRAGSAGQRLLGSNGKRRRFQTKEGYEDIDYNPDEEGTGTYYYQALQGDQTPSTTLSEETFKKITSQAPATPQGARYPPGGDM